MSGPFWCFVPPVISRKTASELDPLDPGRNARLVPNKPPDRGLLNLEVEQKKIAEEMATLLASGEKLDKLKYENAMTAAERMADADYAYSKFFADPGRKERLRKLLQAEIYFLPKGLKFQRYVDFIKEAPPPGRRYP
uniref:Uncharacterized protein n=1 Tax=Phaeomonas parva TaxID=124430 RepID=A0A7S1U1D9_9STRA|mmetsp:Transcript_27256/g.85819  ORF Transcript_27256/g.85819 Transcript_27256/m.85819 type:complete len:137 (+) Transcript_27256:258-668(+)